MAGARPPRKKKPGGGGAHEAGADDGARTRDVSAPADEPGGAHERGATGDTHASSAAADLRRQAEARLAAVSAADGAPSPAPADTAALVNELRVHQIELEVQNDELRRTQIALEEQRARYADLFERAPVGYLALSVEGVVTDANLMAAHLLGVTQQQLVGRPLTAFILAADQDVYYLRHKQLEQDEEQYACDLRLSRAGSESGDSGEAGHFWAHLEERTRDAAGELLGSILTFSDVHERVLAQEALRRRELEASTLVDNAPDMIMRFDADLRYVSGNAAVERELGIPVQRLIGRSPRETDLPQAQAEAMWQALRRALATGAEQQIEQSLPTPSGDKCFATRVVPERGAQGRVESLLAVSRDVTARKRAEEALAESEQLFRLTFDQAPIGAALVGLDFGFQRVNARFAQMTGYSAAELLERGFPDITHPDDVAADVAEIRRLAAGEIEQYAREKRYVHKNGSIAWGDIVVRPLRGADGQIMAFVALVNDITVRRRADEDLKRLAGSLWQEKERISGLIGSMADEVWLADKQGRFTMANPSALQAFGDGAADGTPVLELAAGVEILRADGTPRPLQEAPALRALSGEVVRNLEEIVRTPGSGELRHRLVNSTPLRAADGAVTGSVSVVRDITGLRRAEEAVRQSEHLLRSTMDNMREGCEVLDFDGRYLYVNRAAEVQNRRPKEEFLGCRFTEVWPGVEQTEVHRLIERCLEERTVERTETELTFPDGASGWFDLNIQPVPEGVLIESVDVTERRHAEEALRETEARYRSVVAASHEGIALQARDGTVLTWNAAAQEIFGPSADEIVGESALAREWDTVHEDGSPWPAADHPSMRTLGTGEPCEDVVMGFKRGGDVRWLNVNTRPLRADGEELPYAVAVSVTDITERRHAEEAAARERERAQSYLDVAEVMLVAIAADGTVTLANRKACQVLGRDESDVVGSNWFDLALLADVREPLRHMFGEMMHDAAESPEHFENAVVTSAGEERLIAWRTTLLRDESGAVVGMLSSGEDITERRQAEQALCESEERYRLLVRNAYDAVYVHEIAVEGPGRLVDVNDRACEMLGYARGELLALGVHAIDTPEQREHSPEISRRVLETGHAVFETEHVRKDGGRVPVEISVSTLELHGRPMVLSVARDITERKKAEAALRQSQAMRDAAERVAGVGSWRVELATARTAWSPETYRLYDVDEQDFDGDFERVLESRVQPGDRQAVSQAMATFLAPGEAEPVDFRVTYRDGSEHVLHAEGSLETDAEGRPVAVTGFVQDVTESRRAEDQIRHLNAELRQLVGSRTLQRDALTRELEAFAYSAAHDLRTPLRAIDGFSAVVALDAAERLTAEDREHLRRVRAAAQHMAQLIDDISSLSQVSRGDLERVPVDVSALAADVADELRAENPGRRVDVRVAAGMTAQADQTLLRLILRQLLENAWKFTAKHATATVEVGVTQAGGQRAFFVRDDGAGFDPRHAEHLFGAFQRLHEAAEYPGRGIGLPTVQRLVAKHGGSVWAEAVVEGGATFYFTLPDEKGGDAEDPRG